MLIIGVTGGLGTGKSTVAKMFARVGARVLDADRIAHDVLKPTRPAWRDVKRTFGRQMFNKDQTIHRARLAARVFHNPAARARLEAIVHPRVIRRMTQQLNALKRAGKTRVVVLDVPLLIEANLQRLVDALVVVTANATAQRRRLLAKGCSVRDVNARMAAQMKLSAKVALADYVVDNSDGRERTRRQVRNIWSQLVATTRKR